MGELLHELARPSMCNACLTATSASLIVNKETLKHSIFHQATGAEQVLILILILVDKLRVR